MRTELYRHFDKEGALLYVGVSLSALLRLSRHAEVSPWFDAIRRVEIEKFQTRALALRAERRAIVEERPLWNIAFNKIKRMRFRFLSQPKPKLAVRQARRVDEAIRELRQMGVL